MRVRREQFFRLIRGESTKNEIWQYAGTKPDIDVFIDDNRISIRGNFELSEDLIFESTSIYQKDLIFDGGNFKNIIFRGGQFRKIIFRRGNYNGFVSIRGGSFQNLLLLGGNFNHWLGTLDGNINTDENDSPLAEDELLINRFQIEGGTYSNNMWISGGKISSLEIKCVTPVKIHCKPNDDKIFDPDQNNYIDRFTSSPQIKNLVISRYSNKDNFYHFSTLTLGKIEFENFTNIGNITISKIALKESISIQNSDLGKTSIIDCDFSRQILYFDSSKINEIALAGSALPQPRNIKSHTKGLLQKKLALSQIKKAYYNMGDSLTASVYQAEELETHMKTLNFGWEKINLKLNSISNKHGQSWSRALFLLLFVSIALYTSYCFSLGSKIDLSYAGWFVFLDNAAFLVEFINPIRKSEFIPKALFHYNSETSIPTASIMIDGIAKIANAYLLYQFIAAFRKHGKKGE